MHITVACLICFQYIIYIYLIDTWRS